MRPAIVLPLLLLIALPACDKDRSPVPTPAPPGSSVYIVNISPTPDLPLHSGQRVRLELKVGYTLMADAGNLQVIVQNATGAFATTGASVSRGAGSEDFALEFKVPATESIEVFVPLFAEGQKATTTVVTREYKVSPE